MFSDESNKVETYIKPSISFQTFLFRHLKLSNLLAINGFPYRLPKLTTISKEMFQRCFNKKKITGLNALKFMEALLKKIIYTFISNFFLGKYVVNSISFQTFFVWTFKIVIDS